MDEALIPEKKILTLILTIRNQKVMLDSDLAELYGVATKVLKQAVRRNIERFPPDFMLELTEEEWKKVEKTKAQSLRSQNVTLKSTRCKHSEYQLFAFTKNNVIISFLN